MLLRRIAVLVVSVPALVCLRNILEIYMVSSKRIQRVLVMVCFLLN